MEYSFRKFLLCAQSDKIIKIDLFTIFIRIIKESFALFDKFYCTAMPAFLSLECILVKSGLNEVIIYSNEKSKRKEEESHVCL